MKFLFRLCAGAAFFIVVLVTVIKFVQGCSFKEAVGIAEQLWKEVSEPFKTCCKTKTEQEDA